MQHETTGEAALPRYSNRPFPAYTFVPGQAPHPTRDPEGHSYGRAPELLEDFVAERWHECEIYLYGIDLFNHGYWWEAHEALEAVWAAAGRQSATGQFIQGVIQIAVAHIKRHQNMHEVARRMAQEGLQRSFGVSGDHCGIDLDEFRSEVRASFAALDGAAVVIRLRR